MKRSKYPEYVKDFYDSTTTKNKQPDQKMGRGLDISSKDICSNLLIIRQMKIKTTIKYIISIRMALNKTQNNNNKEHTNTRFRRRQSGNVVFYFS